MRTSEAKRSIEELQDDLDLFRTFLKSEVWEKLKVYLKGQHYSLGIELRRPASDIATILTTERAKSALQMVETLMSLPELLIEDLETEIKSRSPENDD